MDRRRLIKQTGVAAAGAAIATRMPHLAFAQDASTLTVWDSLNDGPRVEVIESLGASFGEANGVTVEHRGWETSELDNTLPRAVESNQGPAVSQVNNGEALMGPMIRGGQLVDLSPYVMEYGWGSLLRPSLAARCSYNEAGTEFGIGQLWGIPAEAEIVGFYYNRNIFSEHGFQIPATVAEFEALLQSMVDAGVTPIVFGLGADPWQAIHMFGEIHGTMTTREYLDGLIYRTGEQSFEHPSIIDAATKLVEWNNNGFFIEGYESLTADDAAALFQSGEGAILMQGSWQAPSVKDTLGADAGFFLMPPLEVGGATPAAVSATPVTSTPPVLHVGGVGIPYSITVNATDPDMAAAFINHLISEEAFRAWVEAGSLPSGEIPNDLITANTVEGDLYNAWNSALSADAIGHYLDWAAPGFYEELTGQLQRLLGGQVEPAAFASALQEYYAASFTN